MSVHVKANGTYYVRYRIGGQQLHKNFGKGEDAKVIAEAFQAILSYMKHQDAMIKKE